MNEKQTLVIPKEKFLQILKSLESKNEQTLLETIIKIGELLRKSN